MPTQSGGSAWGTGGLMSLDAQSRSLLQSMSINVLAWSDTKIEQHTDAVVTTRLNDLVSELKQRYSAIGANDVAASVRHDGSGIVVDHTLSAKVTRIEFGELAEIDAHNTAPQRIATDPLRRNPRFEDLFNRVFEAARGEA